MQNPPTNKTLLILDFGSQYTHLITRRIRELNIYCQVHSCLTPLSSLSFTPSAIILSGGPHSVYDVDSPHVHPSYLDLNVPILGICYGLQELVHTFSGDIKQCLHKEYGDAEITIFSSRLFQGITKSKFNVWMSHGDQVQSLPTGWLRIAETSTAPFAAVEFPEKNIFGVQFHPEVTHTEFGRIIIENFVKICGIEKNWTMVTLPLSLDKIYSVSGSIHQRRT